MSDKEIKEDAETINRVIDTETSMLRRQRDKLLDALKNISDGFCLSSGHSDPDRFARDIRHWNTVAKEAIYEAKKEV